MRKRLPWLTATVSVLLAVACSDDKRPTVVPPDPDSVTVTGEVTHKDDQVPADGGVTMTLKLENGGTEVLLFGSLFTHPPPSQEQANLYQVIVQVKVGDQVRAVGRRGEGGISLDALTILAQ